MRLLDYECQTTFWEDFTIAERFGAKAIKDTYRRVGTEWKKDRVYGTELSIVLNHKVGIGTKNRTKNLANYTQSYEKDIIDGCLLNEKWRRGVLFEGGGLEMKSLCV